MKAEVKFYCGDIMKAMRPGIYELPDSASVIDFMEMIQQEAGKTLSESEKNSLAFLVNGKPARWETALSEGDNLKVLFKIFGG